MIQFNVGGQTLQIDRNIKLSFMYQNSIFSFDKMELNRSQIFDIPDTKENNDFFLNASDPHNNGETIRRIYDAEMIADSVIIKGLLYILSYEDRNYKASFIYGEMTGLRRIRESGKLAEYCNFADELTINNGTSPVVNVSGTTLPDNFKFYNYVNGVSDANKNDAEFNFMPTVKLRYLIDTAAAALGVSVSYPVGSIIDKLGLILSGDNAESVNTSLSVSGSAKAGFSITANSFFSADTEYFTYRPVISLSNKFQQVHTFRALVDCTLVLPAYTSGGKLAVVAGNGYDFLSKNRSGYARPFFQGFDTLAQNIELKKGDYFTLVRESDWSFVDNRWINDFDTTLRYSFEVFAGSDDKADFNDIYSLQKNLPDVTLTDLLKTFASLQKVAIRWSKDTRVVSFFDFNFSAYYTDLTSKLISIVGNYRTIGDFAQENKIIFKSDDYVTEQNRYSDSRKINNKTLEKEKTLFEIPFSEGNLSASNVVVSDFVIQEDGTYNLEAGSDTLAIAPDVAGGTYLRHIKSKQIQNDYLKYIFDKSTTVKMVFQMYFHEFNHINDTRVYLVRNNKYIIFAGSWEDNKALLEMVKID